MHVVMKHVNGVYYLGKRCGAERSKSAFYKIKERGVCQPCKFFPFPNLEFFFERVFSTNFISFVKLYLGSTL